MDWILVVFVIMGILLAVDGARLLLSDKYEEWMYKSGIWSRKKGFFSSEKLARKVTRNLYGWKMLIIGLLFITFAMLTILDLWGPIDRFMISDWP